MLALPWIAIFLAAPLLLLGYGVALADGQLGFQAAIPVALLLMAAWAVQPHRKTLVRYIGHALFVVLALALGFHLLPGFHNPRVFGPGHVTSDAVPFTMDLNLDESLVGFWLLLVLPWIRPKHDLRASLVAGIGGMVLTTAACLTIGVCLGLIAWEPKWPSFTVLWLLNNLLLVTFTEEALFRGYLQGGLSRLLRQRPYGNALALGVTAALFGVAHAAGGWPWIVLGSVAGIGYGLAYRFGGLQASVSAHFGLNVAHFFLFTYPMLQPPGHA